MFKEVAADISCPGSYRSDVKASHNKLTSAMRQDLGIVTLDSLLVCHAPLSTKRPAKSTKTYTIHEQI